MRALRTTLVAAASLLALLLTAPAALAAPALQVALRGDANQVQEVQDFATGGKFRLRFEGAETTDFEAQPSETAVEGALNALPTIAADGGSVSVKREGASGRRRYYVHFDGGPLAGADAPMLEALPASPPPLSSGPVPTLGAALQQAAGLRRGDERLTYTVDVSNTGPDPTSGPVKVEVELPGGAETYVLKANNTGGDWACVSEPATASGPARVTCTRSTVLNSGSSWAGSSGLTIATAIGADVPVAANATATVSGGGTIAPASASDVVAVGSALSFGVEAFDASILDAAGAQYDVAGGHPFLSKANFAFAQRRIREPFEPNSEVTTHFPVEEDKHIVVDVPPGFVGNARALPVLCESAAKLLGALGPECPAASAVGGITVKFSSAVLGPLPIFAIEPEYGAPAEFGFRAGPSGVYTFVPRLRPAEGYAIRFESALNPAAQILAATPELCGYGAKLSGTNFAGCRTQAEALEKDPEAKPLITNPTRCGGGPPIATIRADSWESPGAFNLDGSPDLTDPNWKSTDFANPELTECGKLPFEPTSRVAPTSHEADSATGLEVGLQMPTGGLEGRGADGKPDPEAVSQASMRRAKVTFPEGMAVNPSAGVGLGACTKSEIELGTNEPVSCPESSKVGTVEIETPLIEDTLKGAVYVAHQGDVEGALVGFYLVFDSPKNGLLIKIPARVDFESPTGRLVSVVEESPQQPFSAVRIHFPQGPRSPLLTPPKCGEYQIAAELTPWNGGSPVSESSGFSIDSGPGGGPCPSGGLDAGFTALTSNPTAGQTSPFVVRLSRPDGSQRLRSLTLRTPPGLTAYLKGVPYCPDSTLDSIPTAPGTGQAQIDHPSCPAASQLGSATIGAGAGSEILYVHTAKAYLAGPYKGAPLSLALVAPAVAGPLDLGNVVVRTALYLDPESAQLTAVSDPIPTILHGIKPDIRDIRVSIDRPGFVLNPTDCAEKQIGATVGGEDGASADLSNRFQVGGCEHLAFEPHLYTRLFGPTHRAAHPKFRAVYTAGAGEANVQRTALTIPRSEFLDQAHIRTVCTRVQFAAKACPKGSVYGYVKAFTPLLDYPVQGPVYLRSSNHKLPDLVFDLHGPSYQPIEAVAVGRVDSIKGQIRVTLEGVPDVPLSKVIVIQQGGHKGLLINSRNICARPYRATVRLAAHDGATAAFRPLLKNARCHKAKRKHRHHRRR